ncbi:MAG: 1-acyl-sn-glycerol-3-phosphate acyltransferase [Planctomycetes bacterium]|nr:1-acyl-sn-glycerol-3-phosphate acyltransferase [Planctomycetota bacterium]
MAWKSFYLAAGILSTASLPFWKGYVGGGNLPDGPYILAANHSSFLDGPLLALAHARATLRRLHMIAYEEPFHHPFMGWFLRTGGCIPFKRGNRQSQATMLQTALGWLKAGEPVGIFPEGHINQKPRLNRPRPGVALLALESGVPILPAAITGSDETFPTGRRIPKVGRRVQVVFGQPLHLLDKERLYASLPSDERRQLVKNLNYRIMCAIGRLAGRECRE